MSSELEGLETHGNLKKAFVEEASTMLRYLYFAKIADFEGFDGTATLFRELAEGGNNNVHGNLDFLRAVGDPLTELPIGDTARNIEAAISAEIFEFNELYPRMADMARKEGFTDIASWFESLAKLKRSHVARLKAIRPKQNSGSPS